MVSVVLCAWNIHGWGVEMAILAIARDFTFEQRHAVMSKLLASKSTRF